MKKILYTVIIGIFCLSIISCTGKPRRYLAIEAGLISKGQTKDEVVNLMGPPQATRKRDADKEEWYYYEINQPFYHSIPLIGSKISEKRIESIRIIFKENNVIDVLYYLPTE